MHGVKVEDLRENLTALERIADTFRRLGADQVEATTPPSPQADAPTRQSDKASTAKLALAARKRRHLRAADQADLFADPAWDMLLELYVAGHAAYRVSVSSACLASNVPPTTALRWLRVLENRGLATRIGDPTDRRRSLMALTACGIDLVERMLPAHAG